MGNKSTVTPNFNSTQESALEFQAILLHFNLMDYTVYWYSNLPNKFCGLFIRTGFYNASM